MKSFSCTIAFSVLLAVVCTVQSTEDCDSNTTPITLPGEEHGCEGINEIYKLCGSRCEPTCQGTGPDVCDASCHPGCYCEEGYVREESTGVCVEESLCKCKENEEFLACGTACPATCQDGEPELCTKQCVMGCFCKKGYLLDSTSGECVEESCGTCGANQTYTSCGTACERTCEEPNRYYKCIAQCVPGCFCDEGFLKSNATGECVEEEVCKERKALEDACKANQHYNDCGTACPRTCQKPDVYFSCLAICKPGCFCDEGYLLDNTTGECIEESICKEKYTTCGFNEEYNSCGSSCEKTCQTNASEICPDVCVEGCFCKEGFLRDEQSGICVNATLCDCPANANFTTCASVCSKTCQSEAPHVCPLICKFGCVCNPGYLSDESSGECIPEDKCDCDDPNAEYSSCGSACPETCQNYSEPRLCILICVEGCFCKKGYVLDENTKKCVAKDCCPEVPVTTLAPAEPCEED